MKNENQNTPDINQIDQRAPQAVRTVSSDRVCAGCGASITDRRSQAKFCSDACRAKDHRKQQSGRMSDLITSIEEATLRLKAELEGHREG